MSLIYKWSVTNVQVIPQQDEKENIIVGVDWLVTAVDEATKLFATHTGRKQLTVGESFIPYDQITEDQVLNWCFEPEIITIEDPVLNTTKTITRHFKDENEAQVARQVRYQLAKKDLEPVLPWVNLT